MKTTQGVSTFALTTLIVDQNIIAIGGDVGDDEVLHHEIGVEVVSRRTFDGHRKEAGSCH